MTDLDVMADALTAALTTMGVPVRCVVDPSQAVPPCLQLDYTPKPLRHIMCDGAPVTEYEWTAVLKPPGNTSQYLAATWLMTHRDKVHDAIDLTGAVTDTDGIDLAADESTRPTPAYRYTFLAIPAPPTP